jgi:hypothetical protein
MSNNLRKKLLLPFAVVLSLAACKQEPPATSVSQPQAVQTPVKIDFNQIKIKSSISPEEVVLFDNGQQRTMQYLTPQMRTAVRALGFGGVGQYAVLRGVQATQRVTSKQPVFVFAVPNNAQPESYFTLANFAVRDNGTREVIVGGGYMSYSTGVHQDRIVATKIEKMPDQSKAPQKYTLYAMTVSAPLSVGEYALIFYNSQIPTAGFFQGSSDSYFDFGVSN